MTKDKVKECISHRVQKAGNLQYRANDMPAEELGDRRMYMRQILKHTKRFRNVSNAELDNMIIRPIGQDYLLETGEGYEYLIYGSDIKK